MVDGELFSSFKLLLHVVLVPLFINRKLTDFLRLRWRLWHIWVNNLNFLSLLLGIILGVSLNNVEVFLLDGEKDLGNWNEHDNVDVERPLPRDTDHDDEGGHGVTDEKACGRGGDDERHPFGFGVFWGKRVYPDR